MVSDHSMSPVQGEMMAETKAGERPGEQQVQRHGGRSEQKQGVCGGTAGKAQGERGWGAEGGRDLQ